MSLITSQQNLNFPTDPVQKHLF